MFQRSSIIALSTLALALSIAHPASVEAQTGWTLRCDMGACDATSTQCELNVTVYRFASTQGNWVGIVPVPAGWDKVVVQVAKGKEIVSTTINAPQLPGMAFGDAALKDLLLVGTSAVIEVFQTDRLVKSCKFDLSGLAETYKRVR